MDLSLPSLFGAGVLTLATPCVLPMVPVYLAMLAGAGVAGAQRPSRWKLAGATALFVLGFVLVFTLLGLGASSMGSWLQGHRAWLLVVGGILIALFGLRFLGVLRIPLLERTLQASGPTRIRGGLHAFAFGAVFAIGWTPCVGPILGSVLTYTAATTSDPLVGALYLFTYGLGVGIPMLIAGLAADRVLPRLKRLHSWLPRLEKGTGALMVAVGILLVVPSLVGGSLHAAPASPTLANAIGDHGIAVDPPLGAAAGVPRLVEFYTARCPVCERMKPRIETLRADCAGRKLEIITVNVSEPGNRDVAAAWQVSGVPAFVLLREDGSVAERFVGEQGIGTLRAATGTLIGTACGDQPLQKLETTPVGPSCSTQPSSEVSPSEAPPSCGM